MQRQCTKNYSFTHTLELHSPMATTFSLSFSLDSHNHLFSNTHFKSNPKPTSPFLIFPKSPRCSVFLSSSSSSPSRSSSSTLLDPLRTGRFLTNEELEKLQLLEDYKYFQELKSGSTLIRVMRDDEMDLIVGLLAESFGESMFMPIGYLTLLGFLVKQYLIERRALMPHTATLIAYYKGDDDDKEDDVQLAGTVEVSFDKIGANDSPPTPIPPKGSPYICNMTVKKTLRRRGIGWHLLKASEELITQISLSREVYLHCRMIDEAPFSMYTKAGYDVIKTDNLLILLTLQRRKHLMRKLLLSPVLTNIPSSESIDGSSFSNDENLS